MNYSWGSPYFIPQLLGQPNPPATPVAEMWLGAHAKDSSLVQTADGTTSLHDLINHDPQAFLGNAIDAYNTQLPFLMKVLAASQALSIQAHPNKSQALLGFARENQQGIALDSPLRSYKDDNHKPELICALTPFKLMSGFRGYADIVQNFRLCGLGEFYPALSTLDSQPCSQGLKSFFLEVMQTPLATRQQVLDQLFSSLASVNTIPEDIRQTCLYLQSQYPFDIGILSPLFLNLLELQPGEAIYISAGILHSYLEGSGIEVMANSDNVLRGGLTPKHVDLAELTQTLDFTPFALEKTIPVQVDSSTQIFHTPAAEFLLKRINLSGVSSYRLESGNMPMLLLCDGGELKVSSTSDFVIIQKGESVFISADSRDIMLEGTGSIWLTTVPCRQN